MLRRTLEILGPRSDLLVLIAGKSADAWRGTVPQTVIPLGYLGDDCLIAASYAASDFVVVPSAVEIFPTALSRPWPAAGRVSFDVGGVRDAVRHGETGLLARPGDAGALAAAIKTLLDDDAARSSMGAAALQLARAEFAAELQVKRFESLYLSLVGRAAA